jgi:hypothetical protein
MGLLETTLQSCKFVTECIEIATANETPAFWDLKAGLAAIGIGIALFWQIVTFCSTRSRRTKDQKWSMYKDEIYTPFLDLLKRFEEEVQVPQLPTQISEMAPDALQEKVGEFAATLSEIEVFCTRADNHTTAKSTNLQPKFTEESGHLNSCLGKLLSAGANDTAECANVASAYGRLISELRIELTNCRLLFEN